MYLPAHANVDMDLSETAVSDILGILGILHHAFWLAMSYDVAVPAAAAVLLLLFLAH